MPRVAKPFRTSVVTVDPGFAGVQRSVSRPTAAASAFSTQSVTTGTKRRSSAPRVMSTTSGFAAS